jgi:hypothetical protein
MAMVLFRFFPFLDRADGDDGDEDNGERPEVDSDLEKALGDDLYFV